MFCLGLLHIHHYFKMEFNEALLKRETWQSGGKRIENRKHFRYTFIIIILLVLTYPSLLAISRVACKAG